VWLCYLIDSFENCPADAAERAIVAEKARRPVRSQSERLNFEYEVARDHILPDFSRILRVAERLLERREPSLERLNNKVAHFAGPVVEFERRGSKKASARKNFIFGISEPVPAESSQTREAVCLKSRPNDCLHENTTSLLHNGALKIFFRTKVSKKAALTYLQGRGEFSDGEPFETFERSDIYSFLQNRAASLYTARTPALIRCGDAGWRSGYQWLPRTAQRMVA
jgi:hypothetical protein